ncbi:MAG: radical SAM protein [Candidatus Odinarchaeia archaeon]
MKKMIVLSKIALRMMKIAFLHKKIPVFGSVDITNSCNLKCSHCYWWKTRNTHKELTVEEWRKVIRREFVKRGVYAISITGGEPLLRPDVIEAIIEEMKGGNVSVVTNGTLPLINFGIGYFISIDGPEKIHNMIRGADIYQKVKQNIIEHPEIDVVLNMTINKLNYKYVSNVIYEWYPYAKAITFQFHTPFSYNDDLWLPYGKERNATIDKLIRIKDKYPEFIANTTKQLNVFRNKNWSSNCPTWFFLNLDSEGKIKQPCVIASSNENDTKPICERCGLACNAGAYAALNLGDVEWFRVLNIAKREIPHKATLIKTK